MELVKKAAPFILIVILSFLVGCRKENFLEPVDPFVNQELEANPKVITIGEGINALKLKTNQANVIKTETGIRIKGSLFVENSKYGDIPLSTGDFELVKDNTKNIYTTITGYSKVDLPHEGLLKNLKIIGMPTALLGFKKGSEFDLGAFEWTVNPDRYYFYYENDNPIQASVTNSSIKNIKKIAIDPTDPYTFFTCNFEGTKLGNFTDVGMAVSTQGLIPFVPAVTLGGIQGFNGNLYFTGTIPLKQYPIAVSGEACIAFNSGDPNGYSNFFSGKESNFKLGLNGKATFDHTILDWLRNVELELGSVTLTLEANKSGNSELKFAGERKLPTTSVSDFLNDIIGVDWDFLDYFSPVETKETIYGTIGTELSDWQLGFKSEAKLKNLPGFGDLDMGTTQLEVSSDNMYFKGEAVVCGLNRVGVEGYADRKGNFKLTGYGRSDLHFSKGRLSIGYSLGMDVTLLLEGGKFTFRGEFKFKGKACVRIAKKDFCASVSFGGSTSVSSDGSFEICFSIGIGKLGFDVCIRYERTRGSSEESFAQIVTVNEIPLEQVPLENRFPAEECDEGIKY
jgi:hypothetical protein